MRAICIHFHFRKWYNLYFFTEKNCCKFIFQEGSTEKVVHGIHSEFKAFVVEWTCFHFFKESFDDGYHQDRNVFWKVFFSENIFWQKDKSFLAESYLTDTFSKLNLFRVWVALNSKLGDWIFAICILRFEKIAPAIHNFSISSNKACFRSVLPRPDCKSPFCHISGTLLGRNCCRARDLLCHNSSTLFFSTGSHV